MREKITLSDIQNSSTNPERRSTGGEMSEVTVLEKKGLVVKYSRQNAHDKARHAILREALIVAEMEQQGPAPLEVPSLQECVLSPIPYVAFSLVRGETLGRERISLFTKEEKEALGRKMGEFVAWTTTAMSLEAYEQILGETDQFVAPSRSAVLERCNLDIWSVPTIRPQTQGLIRELWSMHRMLKSQDELKPTMIGHYDLHPGNLVFEGEYRDRRLKGVIDFGVMQPSTPECELRHAAALGKGVLDSAIGEFEQRTQTSIDRSRLGFWALAQTASTCVNYEKQTAEFTFHHGLLARLLDEHGEPIGLESRDFSYSN